MIMKNTLEILAVAGLLTGCARTCYNQNDTIKQNDNVKNTPVELSQRDLDFLEYTSREYAKKTPDELERAAKRSAYVNEEMNKWRMEHPECPEFECSDGIVRMGFVFSRDCYEVNKYYHFQ